MYEYIQLTYVTSYKYHLPNNGAGGGGNGPGGGTGGANAGIGAAKAGGGNGGAERKVLNMMLIQNCLALIQCTSLNVFSKSLDLKYLTPKFG